MVDFPLSMLVFGGGGGKLYVFWDPQTCFPGEANLDEVFRLSRYTIFFSQKKIQTNQQTNRTKQTKTKQNKTKQTLYFDLLYFGAWDMFHDRGLAVLCRATPSTLDISFPKRTRSLVSVVSCKHNDKKPEIHWSPDYHHLSERQGKIPLGANRKFGLSQGRKIPRAQHLQCWPQGKP